QSHRWQIVARVADAVARLRDYDQLLKALAEALAGELPLDHVAFFELRADEAVVVAAARRDEASPLPERARVTPPPHRETGVLEDAATSPWDAERALAAAGLPAVVRVPVSSGGERVGALSVARQAPFDPDDVALLEALGSHLAHAIANVRAQLRADELAMLKE